MIILWAPTFYNTNADPKYHKVETLIRHGAAPAAFCTESCDRGGSCEVGVGVARPGPANPPCLLSCACERGCGRCLAKLPGASEIMARTSMQMQRVCMPRSRLTTTQQMLAGRSVSLTHGSVPVEDSLRVTQAS